MLNRLITVILCFYALTSFAQTGGTERLKIDSAGSFHHALIPLPGTMALTGNHFKVFMQTKVVNLKELVVRPWPATYQQFKKEFIEMEIEDPLANLDLHLPSPEEMRMLACSPGGTGISIISFLYDKYSKEALSKKIYEGLMKKEKAAVRYNNALISKITGIKDETEIRKFIDFCALQVQFILDSSDYELYAAIMDCYQNFCINEYDTLVPSSSE